VAARFGEFFDSLGKALAVVAGLAIVVYIIGGLGMYARLQRQGLPPEAIVPEIPRERLALLGLTQLLVTVVLGLLLVWLARRVPAREPQESWRVWWQRVVANWAFMAASVAGFLIVVLLAPWSVNGVLLIVLLLVAFVWFLGWGRRVDPIVVFAVALAVAVGFTVLRQLEFPTPHTMATVTLTPRGAELVPEARLVEEAVLLEGADGTELEAGPQAENRVIRGRVLVTTDSELLLGWESQVQRLQETETGEQDLTLLRIPRSRVGELAYDAQKDPVTFSDSVVGKLGGPDLKCLIPICQLGSNEESRASGIPFFF
jgi:hypothetical protein